MDRIGYKDQLNQQIDCVDSVDLFKVSEPIHLICRLNQQMRSIPLIYSRSTDPLETLNKSTESRMD